VAVPSGTVGDIWETAHFPGTYRSPRISSAICCNFSNPQRHNGTTARDDEPAEDKGCMVRCGLRDLPIVQCDDVTFRSALVLSLNIRSFPVSFAVRSPHRHTCGLCDGSKTLTVAPVMVMISVSPDVICEPAKHCKGKGFQFVVQCWKCGIDSAVTIRCRKDVMNLSVSTWRCCDHCFAGRVVPMDHRLSSLHLTASALNGG
jgi:hypothetical protein